MGGIFCKRLAVTSLGLVFTACSHPSLNFEQFAIEPDVEFVDSGGHWLKAISMAHTVFWFVALLAKNQRQR
jgi:hypothetical protein